MEVPPNRRFSRIIPKKQAVYFVVHHLPPLSSHTVQRTLDPIERLVDIVQGVLG